MIHAIQTAITDLLDSRYGYPIYTDKVLQGLKTPCFFVFCLTDTQKYRFANRYKKTCSFAVQYLSANKDDPSPDKQEKADELELLLEFLRIKDGMIKANEMSTDFQGEPLTITLTYPFFVLKKTTEQEAMQRLEQQSHINDQ